MHQFHKCGDWNWTREVSESINANFVAFEERMEKTFVKRKENERRY